MRAAAARGVLPVSREELIEILVYLADDPEETTARQARASLDAFPDDALKPLLESAFTSEAIFEFFSRPPFRSLELIEVIILNKSAPDTVIARMAEQVPCHLIDAVLINVMRLLRCPEILEGLERNVNNSPDTLRRLGELRQEFFEKRNTFVPVTPMTTSETSPGISTDFSDETDVSVDAHPLTTGDSQETVVAATLKLMELDGEELHQGKLTTLQKIARMTVSERVQAAIKGSRDERMILIRDSNKVVSRAVLSSPKISENEVEWIAQMRNVNEEVLRLIGVSRAWAKNYSIMHNLVRNSRAPVAITLRILNRLLARDLKALAKNKNVPEVIRKSAQRLVQTREG